MKITIYNSGYGWSFPIGNYKNKNEEPIWVNCYFIENYTLEPMFTPNEKGKDSRKIFINEGSFNKYVDANGKLHVTLSIFSYELISKIDLTENNLVLEDGTRYQSKLNDGDTDMFGGNIKVEEEELPFY